MKPMKVDLASARSLVAAARALTMGGAGPVKKSQYGNCFRSIPCLEGAAHPGRRTAPASRISAKLSASPGYLRLHDASRS